MKTKKSFFFLIMGSCIYIIVLAEGKKTIKSRFSKWICTVIQFSMFSFDSFNLLVLVSNDSIIYCMRSN
jgi:hypothetical protein